MSTIEAQWSISAVSYWGLSVFKLVKTGSVSTCISLPASGNGFACGLCDKGLRGTRRRRGSHEAGPTDMGGGEASGSVRSGGMTHINWLEYWKTNYNARKLILILMRLTADFIPIAIWCAARFGCQVGLQKFTLNNFLFSWGIYNKIWI